MKNKKVLVIDSMKDIVIQEHAYFGYHLDQEQKALSSTYLYFSKKEDNPELDAIEKTISFTHLSSLIPAVVFLGLAIVFITVVFALFMSNVLPFTTQNFLLFFFLPLFILISIGSFFAIRRTLQISKFVKEPNKNLNIILNKVKK